MSGPNPVVLIGLDGAAWPLIELSLKGEPAHS